MSGKARSIFAVMALILFLGTGAAHALPSVEGPRAERVSGMLVAIWDWAASLFEAKVLSTPVFEAANGSVPSTPPPSEPQTDIGGFIDPNGGG